MIVLLCILLMRRVHRATIDSEAHVGENNAPSPDLNNYTVRNIPIYLYIKNAAF